MQICATPPGLTLWLLAALLLPAPLARAATNDLTTAIQRGLFEEEANQNLGAAIQAYQSVASQFDKDRKLAATAIFRLGECYRKQGNTNDSATQYERILRDFSDQPTLVTLSRQNLAALGTSPPATVAPALSDAARKEQKRLLTEEMWLVQKQLDEQKQRVQNGTLAPGDLLPLQRQMLEIRRQVAALDAGLPLSVAAPETTASSASTEADEVRRIQALIKDSPDLVNAPVENGLTLLQSAASKGKLAVVKQLLDSGAAVDGLQQPGPTPLHYAAANGHKAVVDLLLSKGAKVDAQTDNGVTPLHLAARQGYESVAKVLLAAGAPVNAQIKGGGANPGRDDLQLNGFISGQAPLHLAAKAGYTGMVQLLLAKGADVNAEDGDGRTPLSYAAQRPAILQLLLASQANPNGGRLDLPLATAAYYGDIPALKLLLANGANPNTNSALSMAVNLPFGQIPPRGAKLTPLFLAVTRRHSDAVTELLRCKADPNLIGGYSTRPVLGEALSDAPTLRVLLDGGADPNASNQGTPLLMQAVADKNQPAVELLLAHKADVNAARSDGWTALFNAVNQGDKAIAELLLKAGAAVNIRNKDGQTPLWVAVDYKQPELAALLLANKADPNAKMNNGLTALHLAVVERQQELVELLLANKADPNARNNAGQTPLNVVKNPSTGGLTASMRSTLADLLRQHGAVDDLPQLDRIEARRPSTGYLGSASLTKGTNDWSQFTLLELIALQYGFLSPGPSWTEKTFYSVGAWFNTTFSQSYSFGFPDFAHLRIRRPAPDRKSWLVQTVDLSPTLEAGDCSKDVPLGWGDVVEITEADHPLNEKWPGFSKTELANLKKCLTRQVQIIINGQATNLTLTPQIFNVGEPKDTTIDLSITDPDRYHAQLLGEPSVRARTPFWLKPVLLQSKLVLTSSDLSRVKVTRRDPAGGQKREWVVDCTTTSTPPDFWLRDGDKVEVPEKGEASAAAGSEAAVPK